MISSPTALIIKHHYPLQIAIRLCSYLSTNNIKMKTGLHASYRKNDRYHVENLLKRSIL